MFFVVFLGAIFSNLLQFQVPFGDQFGRLFGVSGNLENKLKILNGVRFSHVEGSFCRHDFHAKFSDCFVCDFFDYVC